MKKTLRKLLIVLVLSFLVGVLSAGCGSTATPVPTEKPPLLVVDPSTIDWEPIEKLGPGAWIKVLYHEEDTGAGDYLLKFDDGFVEPLHSHPGAHHIYIISGTLVDSDGNDVLTPGMFFLAPATVEHGPVTAKGDVIMFAYFDGPIFYPEK